MSSSFPESEGLKRGRTTNIKGMNNQLGYHDLSTPHGELVFPNPAPGTKRPRGHSTEMASHIGESITNDVLDDQFHGDWLSTIQYSNETTANDDARSHEYCDHILSTMHKMTQEDDEGCDLEICFRSEKVSFHSCVSFAACPMLGKWIKSGLASAPENDLATSFDITKANGKTSLVLKNDSEYVNIEIWKTFRTFMYSGLLHVEENYIFEKLLRIAVYLQFETLISACITLVPSHISISNALDILAVSAELHLNEMTSLVLDFVDKNFDSIVTSNQDAFYHLPADVVQTIISRDTLHTSREVAVVLNVANWTMHDADARMETFCSWATNPTCIRLSNMSREELIEVSQHGVTANCKVLRRAIYNEALSRVNGGAGSAASTTAVQQTSKPRVYSCDVNRNADGETGTEQQQDVFTVTHCETTIGQHDRAVCCLIVYRDFLITGSADGKIRVFNGWTWELVCVLHGHTQAVVTLKRIDDGRLVSASPDKTLRVWSLLNWECLAVIPTPRSSICSLAIVGYFLVTGADDGTLKSWGLRNLSLYRTVHAHTHVIWALAAYGSSLVISGSSDTSIKVWQVDDNNLTLVHSLSAHADEVQALTIDEERHWLFSGSDDGTIKIHDCRTWQCIKTVPWSNRAVLSLVAYGGYLIAGLGNGAVSVWDLDHIMQSDASCKNLKEHSSCVMALAILKGKLVSASYDRTVKIWS